MRIADFMTPDPVTASPNDNVGDAIRVMVLKGFRHLPVVDAEHKLVGIVSERDLRGVEQHTKVASVMTDKPHTMTPQSSLQDATEELAHKGVGCLPVIKSDTDSSLVGLVTSFDVLGMHKNAHAVLDVAQILVPVDLEDAAYDALTTVYSLFPTAQTTALHVLPTESAASPGALLGDTTDDSRQAAAHKSLEATLSERGLEGVAIMVEMGTPHEHIAEAALRLNADLVVIPPHNKGVVERLFMGSVTSKVVRSAPCPVLVMRGELPRGWKGA